MDMKFNRNLAFFLNSFHYNAIVCQYSLFTVHNICLLQSEHEWHKFWKKKTASHIHNFLCRVDRFHYASKILILAACAYQSFFFQLYIYFVLNSKCATLNTCDCDDCKSIVNFLVCILLPYAINARPRMQFHLHFYCR